MYRYALICCVFLAGTAPAAIKLKRGNELVESYRELFPNAFQSPEGARLIRATWMRVKSLLPQEGKLSEHTAPAILAGHVLANQVCALAAPALVDELKTVTDFARHFWGRAPRNDEMEALDEWDRTFNETKPAARDHFVQLCTLFGNSLAFATHDEE